MCKSHIVAVHYSEFLDAHSDGTGDDVAVNLIRTLHFRMRTVVIHGIADEFTYRMKHFVVLLAHIASQTVWNEHGFPWLVVKVQR